MKVHCLKQWQATLQSIRAVGAAKEGDSRSAHTRAVWGGSGKFARGKEWIWRRELEGGRGVIHVTWGRVMWRDYKWASMLKVTK